jgi:hypothetical protein
MPLPTKGRDHHDEHPYCITSRPFDTIDRRLETRCSSCPTASTAFLTSVAPWMGLALSVSSNGLWCLELRAVAALSLQESARLSSHSFRQLNYTSSAVAYDEGPLQRRGRPPLVSIRRWRPIGNLGGVRRLTRGAEPAGTGSFVPQVIRLRYGSRVPLWAPRGITIGGCGLS